MASILISTNNDGSIGTLRADNFSCDNAIGEVLGPILNIMADAASFQIESKRQAQNMSKTTLSNSEADEKKDSATIDASITWFAKGHKQTHKLYGVSREEIETDVKCSVEMAARETDYITIRLVVAGNTRVGGDVKLDEAESRVKRWLDAIM